MDGILLIVDFKYSAECPFSVLYTISGILKLILAIIGSQYRFLSMDVTWSVVRGPLTNRAATFWILCSMQYGFFRIWDTK